PLGALEPLEKAPALRAADHGVHRREGKADPTGRVSVRIAAAARPALQPAAARSNSSARWVAASRTAARSPAKICRSVTIAPPRRPLPNQTRPTGLAGVPPPGPATPVIATESSTGACASAPAAIAAATSA